MSSERVRVGLVGCGGAMSWHANALLARPDAAVVGLADPSPEQIALLRSRVPALAEVPAFASYEELFEQVALDAIEVASPHTMHYPVVRAALERGLHVLCEKPLTCRSDHARAG